MNSNNTTVNKDNKIIPQNTNNEIKKDFNNNGSNDKNKEKDENKQNTLLQSSFREAPMEMFQQEEPIEPVKEKKNTSRKI